MKILFNYLFITFALLMVSGWLHAKDLDECPDVDSCIERVFEVAVYGKSYNSINHEERIVAKKFLTFGEEAVGPLVELLASNDENIAQIAAAALWEFEEIDERYLDQIVAALDGPYYLTSLPAVVGYIQTDRAAKVAVDRFLKSPNPLGDQHSTAVRHSGLRSLPFIVQALLCESGCPKNTKDLGSVLAEMPDEVKINAVKKLGALIASLDTSQSKKTDLILVVAQIGPSSILLEEDLLLLRGIDKALESIINHALVEMRSKASGNILADALKKEPNQHYFFDLVYVGIAGKNAEPTVLKLLQHKDRHIRHGAATALAFIGSKLSLPQLSEAATDDTDVVLNLLATRALGQIGSIGARPVLEKLGKSHWHESVRRSAAEGLDNLSSDNYSRLVYEDLVDEFYDWSSFNTKSCSNTAYTRSDEINQNKLYRRTDEAKVEKLTYKSEIISYGPADYEQQVANDPDGIIDMYPGNIKEHRKSVDQIPDVAFKVIDGWLVGTSRGEWGGELVHLDKNLESEYLIETNVDDIYYFNHKYIAITGLAHMGTNHGVIYTIERTNVDKWKASVSWYLPGAPESSWITDTGELIIDTYSGGSIVINKDGDMSLAECTEYRRY